jgi:Ca2+-binding EF-hand superfamily protein
VIWDAALTMRTVFILLLALAPIALAADPASGKLERGIRQFTPKADAFVPGAVPHFRAELLPKTGVFRRDATAVVQNQYEVLFLARTRPVRIRIIGKTAGQTLYERFEAHLKELFAAYDRDQDGALNRYEAELIISKAEFRAMLRGGFGFRGQHGALASLDLLDRDGDGKGNFQELADYYSSELPMMTQSRGLLSTAPNSDQLTAELFARLDANKDGQLSEQEMKNAERLLATLDADEDETVSTGELLANAVRSNNRLGSAATMEGMMMSRPGNRTPPSTDLHAHLGELPPTVIAQVIQKYDLLGDQLLSPREIRFVSAVFDRLDANQDGKLSATELDAWRTGEPDVIVTLTSADQIEMCRAEAVAGKGDPNGIEIPKPTTSDRIVLRVGPQVIDLAAMPHSPVDQVNPYAYLFPANKQHLEEKELVGPEYQFLRVVFEPADYDGDGKLTKDEFDRYFALQMKTARLGFSLTHITRVPNLFQLLDTNSDGKLGVKELRTAYERLIPLEPSGGKEVSQSILQSSAMIRFGNTVYGVSDAALSNPQINSYNDRGGASAGLIWFRKMDRNGDGDVSRAEFLGSKEDFDMLDTNQDGLISLEEASAFEEKARPKK